MLTRIAVLLIIARRTSVLSNTSIRAARKERREAVAVAGAVPRLVGERREAAAAPEEPRLEEREPEAAVHLSRVVAEMDALEVLAAPPAPAKAKVRRPGVGKVRRRRSAQARRIPCRARRASSCAPEFVTLQWCFYSWMEATTRWVPCLGNSER